MRDDERVAALAEVIEGTDVWRELTAHLGQQQHPRANVRSLAEQIVAWESDVRVGLVEDVIAELRTMERLRTGHESPLLARRGLAADVLNRLDRQS